MGSGSLRLESVERLIFFFPSQLNRPKVNKIVEILEKAKSCYWPALQNVYTNVTEGERWPYENPSPSKKKVSAPPGRGWAGPLLTLGWRRLPPPPSASLGPAF